MISSESIKDVIPESFKLLTIKFYKNFYFWRNCDYINFVNFFLVFLLRLFFKVNIYLCLAIIKFYVVESDKLLLIMRFFLEFYLKTKLS